MTVRGHVMVASTVLVSILLTSVPAFAQVDLVGTWAARVHEDVPYRGPGPQIGDFLGMPLNAEGRARAEAYSPSLLAKPEHQCIMYTSYYLVMEPFGMQITSNMDPISGDIISWRIGGIIDRAPHVIWMDGRPHPSKSAPHSSSGFSTGRWEGNTLVAYTTHLTEGIIWRSGVVHSDQATITEFFVRHGSTLMVTMMLEDPIYLEEPMVRSNTWQIDPAVRLLPETCQPQVEIAQAPETVPHYLPGANPFLNEMTRLYNIPTEAVRGGAATMYPEFQKKLKGYVPPAK